MKKKQTPLQNLLKKLIWPTSHCKRCFQKIKNNNFISLLKTNQILCNSCISFQKPEFIKYKIQDVNCLSLYYYNDYFKEQLYKLKGCYDIELSRTFLYPFSKELKLLFHGYYLILIPSSKADDEKRGFNHVEEIFKYLNMPILKILSKKFNVKQSDRNFNQRKLILYDLKVNHIKSIYNKKILIVDDVCTTGNTISAAIKLLKEGKPKKIKVLTLCKVKNLDG